MAMTVGDLKSLLADSDLSDNDKLIVSAQDGSVWEDVEVHQEVINGETVCLVELVGDGDGTFGIDGDDDLDYITESIEGMGDDEF